MDDLLKPFIDLSQLIRRNHIFSYATLRISRKKLGMQYASLGLQYAHHLALICKNLHNLWPSQYDHLLIFFKVLPFGVNVATMMFN